MTEHTYGNGIVVGVNGSEASMAALRWAAEQATVLHTCLVAVHAWEPAASGHAPYAPVPDGPTIAQEREQAAQVLAATVREALDPRTSGAVRRVVVEGPPSRVLLQQARGALLLALGRKAHGNFGLPSVGPVGRECLRHSTVPVVTVPVAEPSREPQEAVDSPSLARSGAS
ncbi:universal stress protein [Streptomyces sp. MBT65]|uniref:universal stress protein n=1 Tax=Streptomyces sp. MBT65 TaxID=1488395 RepID=UPI001909C060|nr:universal stress protein [Streptomyces sp. MBT65]MBK3576434.1 universal stress protein [Streptomyces sp. MBT65]